MIIQIEFPDVLPEGRGASFKKGIAEILIKNATTPIGHTPNDYEKIREQGRLIGEFLSNEILNIVRK